MSCQLGIEKFLCDGKKIIVKGWLNNVGNEDIESFDKMVLPLNKNILEYIDHDGLNAKPSLKVGTFDFDFSVYYLQDTTTGGYVQVHFVRPKGGFRFPQRSTKDFYFTINLIKKIPPDTLIVAHMEEGVELSIEGVDSREDLVLFETYSSREFYGLDGTLEASYNLGNNVYTPLEDIRTGFSTTRNTDNQNVLMWVIVVAVLLAILYFLFMRNK